MVYRTAQNGWLVAACAAWAVQLAGFAIFPPCARACARCDAGDCCTGTVAVPAPSGCPLCHAADSVSPPDSAEHPCRCHLDGRPDQPISTTRVASPRLDRPGHDGLATTAQPWAPRVLGVSREYAAASLSVPIRPVRILQGVWRN